MEEITDGFALLFGSSLYVIFCFLSIEFIVETLFLIFG